MKKLLLVDDEHLVLAGLESMLPWAEMGIKICGTARNGAQALEIIETRRPDIVIADIKMPVLNGLELLEKSYYEFGRPPVFIILTSVEEFEYARHAMKYQAVDYLVKIELTPEILSDSIGRALKLLADIGIKTTVREKDKKTHIIEHVKDYIKQNLDKRLSLNDVATMFNFNPNYLSQLFTKHAGCSFVEYITREKMTLAQGKLLEKDAKIYEISEELGFDSAFYFSKVFKKHTGISPREYVRRAKHGATA